MSFKKRGSGKWTDTPNYIHKTDVDTITTLPADIYPTGTTATVGLKGNMEQNGTPTPTTPIQPQETGDLETVGVKAGQYKIPISSANTTTPIYLGEVQTTRKIKKYEFTGQENISLYNAAGLLGFQYLMGTMQSNMRTNGLCTHFVPQTTGSGRTGDGITFGANNQYLYFTFSAATISAYNLTDVESISSFLRAQYAAGTPVTVWYVLETPTTGIVNEPLRKIGDYADEVSGITIPTITGANTIDVDTTLKPSEVSINYHGWHSIQSLHGFNGTSWN